MTIDIWMPSDEPKERPKSKKGYQNTHKGDSSRYKARTGGKKGYGKGYASDNSRSYSERDRDYGDREDSRDQYRKRDYSRDRDKDRRKGYDRDKARKDYERKDRRDSKPSKNGKGKKDKYERTRSRAGLGADIGTTLLTGSADLGGLAGKAVDYAKYKSDEETIKRYNREAEVSKAKANAMKQARIAREEEEAERKRMDDAKKARKQARHEQWERARARDKKLKEGVQKGVHSMKEGAHTMKEGLDATAEYMSKENREERKRQKMYAKEQKKWAKQEKKAQKAYAKERKSKGYSSDTADSERVYIDDSERMADSMRDSNGRTQTGMNRGADAITKESTTTKRSWFKRKG